ncbi:MAG: ferrochelatase [Anaerolineaceae bacterium]|nr:MAG: ferrochelatase [Anaerolineaceae bacterium]
MTDDPKHSPSIGVLLVNLGTPEAPTSKAVRPYLRQFLRDPRVIEWPRWFWLPLLEAIILRVRPRRSARLYEEIWTDEGSPLLIISQAIAAGLQETVSGGSDTPVKVSLAMRYGQPSIAAGLEELRRANAGRILILPLYPQYSATTVGTIFDEVFDTLKQWRWVPEIRTVNHYYQHPLYIEGIAGSIRRYWAENGRGQRLLLSFHGIPLSYSQKGDPYRRQCRESARLIADALQLDENELFFTFQSRFGPEEWLQPYTDETLVSWAQEGATRVDTICPGFATDCLETLQEMGMENRDLFLEAGGESYAYIPALNDSPDHIRLLADIVRQNCLGW